MDMSITPGPPAFAPAKPGTSANSAEPATDQSVNATHLNTSVDLGSEKHPSKQSLAAAVEKIDKYVNATQRNLTFSVDEASGEIVVKVIATATGELIRQLPSAEALKLAEKLNDETLRLIRAHA